MVARLQRKLLETRHLAVDMFLNEAKIAGRLVHPNIVQVLDVGEVGGALYLAMEYVRGRDLRELVKRLRAAGATMPLDFRSGVMTEFILGVSVDTCDFGATPRINEWIAVTMVGGKKTQVRYAGEGTVKGVFHVKEMVEGARVVRLYSIDADSLQ